MDLEEARVTIAGVERVFDSSVGVSRCFLWLTRHQHEDSEQQRSFHATPPHVAIAGDAPAPLPAEKR
jgi:hypothetical protein